MSNGTAASDVDADLYTPADEHIHDVVIVGGGPAGLAAAWALADRDIILLEGTDRLGGRLKSVPRGPYWVNLGGHLFPGAGSFMERILNDLGLSTIEIPGHKFGLSFNGKPYVFPRVEYYPLRLPMTVRERVAMVRVGLTMLTAVRGWHKAMRHRDGESAAVRRARVADYLSDRSFRDLIGTPPERVDAIFRSAARRAASEIDQQSAGVGVSLFGAVWSGGKSAMALNLDGGSGELGRAFQERLGDRAVLSASVVRVEEVGKLVHVSYERNGQRHTLVARQVVMATPATVTNELVANGLPEDVRRGLSDVTYGPFLTMGILTDENQAMPYDSMYAMTTPTESFDMLFNHANPLRSGDRSTGGSLMVYSGGQPAAELLQKTDGEIRDTYLGDLYRLYPQLRGHITETIVQRWPIGNVYRRPGADFTPVLRYSARNDVRIHLCGDYFAELGNMENAAGSAIEAADRIKVALGTMPAGTPSS